MASVSNSAEGGTNTTDVTTANSGGASGNAFNLVQIGAGANVKFSSTKTMHGALAYQIATRATAANTGILWSNASLLGTTLYSRCYFNFDALPGVTNSRMQEWFDQSFGTAFAGWGIVTGTNFLRIYGPTNTTLTTGTNAVAANTWYRAECKVTLGTPNTASNATIELRWYLGESTTAIETLGPSTFTAVGTITGICPGRFGCGAIANYPTSTDFIYYDTLAASDVDWIGPAVRTDTGSTGATPPGFFSPDIIGQGWY